MIENIVLIGCNSSICLRSGNGTHIKHLYVDGMLEHETDAGAIEMILQGKAGGVRVYGEGHTIEDTQFLNLKKYGVLLPAVEGAKLHSHTPSSNCRVSGVYYSFKVHRPGCDECEGRSGNVVAPAIEEMKYDLSDFYSKSS